MLISPDIYFKTMFEWLIFTYLLTVRHRLIYARSSLNWCCSANVNSLCCSYVD